MSASEVETDDGGLDVYIVGEGGALERVELGGLAEVCAAIGLGKNVVSNWEERGHHDFPAPLMRLLATPVYDIIDVRRWWAGHRTHHERVCDAGARARRNLATRRR